MPLYRLTIEKQMETGPDAGTRWTNVYHMQEADLASAAVHAPVVVDLEKTVYPDNVAIVRYAVHDPLVRGAGFSKDTFAGGTRSVGASATQLPLFNTLLFQFHASSGRPSPKYLRLPLDEGEVASGSIDPAVTGAISASWAVPVAALSYIRDEHGNTFPGTTFKARVQMRQLNWHRRTRPGFKRGWVAR